jgi:cell division protein FtsZ
MDAVNSRCGDAKVFVGAAEDPALGDKLQITLVAARNGETLAGDPAPARGIRSRTEDSAQAGLELDTAFLEKPAGRRTRSRFAAPKPEMSLDEVEKLAGRGPRGRKSAKLRQTQLPLEIVSKGRFDKSEPTVLHGQDLDVPTFVRRNMVFN